MNKERVFLGLSFLLFVVLGAAALTVTSVWATPQAGAPHSPLYLAPPMPTPTPAPLPPGYTPPESSEIDAQANWPDLVVESIKVEPANPLARNEATIKVTIANGGPGVMTPTNNFYVDLYIGSAGVPASGERGLTCDGNCSYAGAGLTVRNTRLPWGCQGFWVGGVGQRYTLTATVVFSEVKSYYLYAQIDTPEVGAPLGRVYEGSSGGEYNNIYPMNSSVWAQVQAPSRFTQSTHKDFYDNYASSLEIVPVKDSTYITDINGVQVHSTSALVLGLFEEPPVFWGTTTTVPSDPIFTNYHVDYNVLEPDSSVYLNPPGAREPDSHSLNSKHTYNQSKPIIATDGVPGSNRVVVVWQDNRYNIEKSAIFLRWSNSEKDMDGGALAPDSFRRQDWGDPATHEMRVNNNPGGVLPPGSAQNPSVAVAPNGDVVVVWQDNRLSPNTENYWDIYLQQYRFTGGTFVEVEGNKPVTTTVCPNAVETHPDITVAGEDQFFIVWQSQCTNQSALWATKSVSRSPSGAITWAPGRYVVDPSGHERRDPRIDARRATMVTEVMTRCYDGSAVVIPTKWQTSTVTSVVWHEDRGLGTGDDIYIAANRDGIAGPFDIDRKVNDDSSTEKFKRMQDQPATAVSQSKTAMTFEVRCPGVTHQVVLYNQPAPRLHIAWRDYRNSTGSDPDSNFPGNDPDIYYDYCEFRPSPNPPYLLTFSCSPDFPNLKVNQVDTGLAAFEWQTSPPKQFDPDVAAPGYVVWADGRNYDNRNYDIYLWSGRYDKYLRPVNHNVNDHAKIHGFESWAFDEYSPDRPPAAWQAQPSIAVSPHPISPTNIIYLAWADNRLNPLGARDNDIFFARSNDTNFANYDLHDFGPEWANTSSHPLTWPHDGKGAGVYISKAFDSCPGLPEGSPACDTVWYKLDYAGVMPQKTWIAIQTRVADTIAELLTEEWWPQNLLWAPEAGYWVPIRGYLGPGSYIEKNGQRWPQGRYAQYRVNMWAMNDQCKLNDYDDCPPPPVTIGPVVPLPLPYPPVDPENPELRLESTPALYYVTLFYGSASGQGVAGKVYLPAVFKNASN